ncbi:hypothetical protein CYMTET_10827 [Cymbomonas tetramitiformis]|uniref:Uncharacterized protein n=1 Tax=Cymbomonas tetramitiformis TaxID=36881 RepID=A0AAE0GNJ0_9CHLO|nr:hypothetical protein CYMTET_10827 [Cymbomonas tetramitiformis]
MITFLPVTPLNVNVEGMKKAFEEAMEILDAKRLGSQRVEAKAILKWLRNPERYKNFQNAGYCRMWRGHEDALALYYNAALREWEKRGGKNLICELEVLRETNVKIPGWLGADALHSSHRAALIAKDPCTYGISKTGWVEEPVIAYLWPKLQADGGWTLIPPKGGVSNPKSGKEFVQKRHWMSKMPTATSAREPGSTRRPQVGKKRSMSVREAAILKKPKGEKKTETDRAIEAPDVRILPQRRCKKQRQHV